MTSAAPVQADFAQGDLLFREGAPANHIFIINSGHVRITRRVFRQHLLLETLGKGNVCGDSAFAAGAFYPVTAEAADAVQVLMVHREQIDAVLLSNPKLVARMVSRLAARLTHAHFRISNYALLKPAGRLMLQLRHEAERNGGMESEVFTPIPFDLPEALATEKAKIDEALRVLVNEDLVEIDNTGRFRICDLEAFDRKLTYLELADRFA